MTRTTRFLAALCCAAVVLVGGVGWSRADAPPPPQQAISPAEVQELIDDLASDSRAARFRAEQKLIAGGEAALQLLPLPASVEKAAAREALVRVRGEISQNAARAELRGEQFSASRADSVSELFAALERETGNRIDVSLVNGQLLSRPWDQEVGPANFFPVLDALTKELQLGWRWAAGPRRVQIVTAPAAGPVRRNHSLQSRYEDAFRITLIEVRPKDNFVDGPVRKLFRFGLRVDVEPRLQPFTLEVIDADFQAEGENGPMGLWDEAAKREIYPTAGAFIFPVDFAARIPDIPSEVNLQGEATVRVAARPVAVRFDKDDVSRSEQRVGQMKLKLRSWRREQNTLTVVLQVAFDEPTPEVESHRQGLLHRDAHLSAGSGLAVRPQSVNLKDVEHLTHTVEYVFDLGSGPGGNGAGELTFFYVAPTLVTNVPLEFKFEHIPLPRE